MNINRTPAPVADFKLALAGLSSSVQNAMSSWHAAQAASLAACSSQPTLLRVRNSLAPMRESLHTHWTAVAAHLQKCHRFSEDAIIWEKSLAEEDPDSGSLSWMEELTLDSDEICLESKDLVRQSDKVVDCLASLTPQLSELLRGSSRLYSTPASPATTAFLGMSPPDGPAAIASTSAALVEIRSSLCVLHQFWTATSEACRSLQKSSETITPDRARKLGAAWKEYQREIVDAKLSIAKSLDAVLIEPPAPSLSRREQRRRGSSKSEMSISSSPRSSPRRMSSLDDDEVPKSCWTFGGFLGKKR